jgi:hypothetical protein
MINFAGGRDDVVTIPATPYSIILATPYFIINATPYPII